MTALTRLLQLDAVPPDARLYGRVRAGGGADRRLHRLARQRAADHQGGRDACAPRWWACASSSRPAARRGSRAIVAERAAEPGSSLYLLVDGAGRKVAGNLRHVPPELQSARPGRRLHLHPPIRTRASGKPRAGRRRAVSTCRAACTLVVGRDIEDLRRFAGTMGRLGAVERRRCCPLLGVGAGLLISRSVLAPHRDRQRRQPHDHGRRSVARASRSTAPATSSTAWRRASMPCWRASRS